MQKKKEREKREKYYAQAIKGEIPIVKRKSSTTIKGLNVNNNNGNLGSQSARNIQTANALVNNPRHV